MDERLAFVASVLVGYTVAVQVRGQALQPWWRRGPALGGDQAPGLRAPGRCRAPGPGRRGPPPPAPPTPAHRRCRHPPHSLPCLQPPLQQVKSGQVYEGIFHALLPDGPDFGVKLRMAKPRRDAFADDGGAGGEWEPVRPTPVLAIPASDLVSLTAVDVRLGAADVGGGSGAAWDDAGGFGTDAAISRARGAWGRERELQRWAPDEGDAAAMMHLEESAGAVGRGWDQFAVNESKFGVKTDYAEAFYTTELDPRCGAAQCLLCGGGCSLARLCGGWLAACLEGVAAGSWVRAVAAWQLAGPAPQAADPPYCPPPSRSPPAVQQVAHQRGRGGAHRRRNRARRPRVGQHSHAGGAGDRHRRLANG